MDPQQGRTSPAHRRPIGLRALLMACALTALLSVGAGVGASYVLLSAGQTGQRGPRGPQGKAAVGGQGGQATNRYGQTGGRYGEATNDNAVWEAIESDPDRVAAAVQDALDPAPADAQSAAEEAQDVADAAQSAAEEAQGVAEEAQSKATGVADELSTLCSDLSLTDALSDDLISCP